MKLLPMKPIPPVTSILVNGNQAVSGHCAILIQVVVMVTIGREKLYAI